MCLVLSWIFYSSPTKQRFWVSSRSLHSSQFTPCGTQACCVSLYLSQRQHAGVTVLDFRYSLLHLRGKSLVLEIPWLFLPDIQLMPCSAERTMHVCCSNLWTPCLTLHFRLPLKATQDMLRKPSKQLKWGSCFVFLSCGFVFPPFRSGHKSHTFDQRTSFPTEFRWDIIPIAARRHLSNSCIVSSKRIDFLIRFWLVNHHMWKGISINTQI